MTGVCVLAASPIAAAGTSSPTAPAATSGGGAGGAARGSQSAPSKRRRRQKQDAATAAPSVSTLAAGANITAGPDGRFVCPHPGCGKTFTKRANAKRHYAIHTGVKPFECIVCGTPHAWVCCCSLQMTRLSFPWSCILVSLSFRQALLSSR